MRFQALEFAVSCIVAKCIFFTNVEGAGAPFHSSKNGAPAPSTAVKNALGYNTRNGKFKRLEPHFQLSTTGSASKERTETAVALPRSRECTKEPIPGLPNYGSKGKFGARAELRNILLIEEKIER